MSDTACWIDLSPRLYLRVTGADAATFLQGQLTQDISQLDGQRALWAAHCSPKGRMLASFLIWKQGDAFCLDAPAELAEAASNRLKRYVLRAQVAVEDARNTQLRLGLCGPGLAQALAAAGLGESVEPGRWREAGGITLVFPDPERALLVAEPLHLAKIRDRLSQLLPQGDAADWAAAGVRAGCAEILPATEDLWVPQMLNWDALGGISFKKGCYTGQEIVARTHYLGKVNRRLFRLRSATLPRIGQTLHHAGRAGETVGQVALVGKPETAGTEFLAVLQREAFHADDLRLDEADSATLERLPLPYTVNLD